MRDAGGAVLIDQMTGNKAVQPEGAGQRVRFITGNGGGKDMAGARCCLEAARAPAAIEVQALNRSFADDGTGVGADIDDASPLAVHAYACEGRKQFDDGRRRGVDDVRTAALTIALPAVYAGTDDEFPLV